ncbi:MAG: hypothetical protein SWO11_05735 [Thermodesulfobacteriota bacterium]|nr:hypothetical protein [Thermodesulfobacteriota bacterium]
MGNWYQNNRRLFREERQALAAACPLLRFTIAIPNFKINDAVYVKAECAVVHGTYSIHVPDTDRDIEYGIVIVFPNDYPKHPPELFCNDPKLPINNIDRHIMKDGAACLGVRSEMNSRWRSNPTIVYFIENMVAPFLVWQEHFDAFQEPPPWGERSHFGRGIREFYAELLGMPVEADIIGFMNLLARKNHPKGHEPCPCNSGSQLRNCHRDRIREARQQVDWQDVQHDLHSIVNEKEKKSSMKEV